MSKNPSGLYVRDRSGRPVLVPLTAIPKELWPDTWFENAYWRFNGALSDSEVKEMYAARASGQMSEMLVQKVAQYIFDYAANCAVAVWLFDDEAHKPEYLEDMRPLLQGLSAMKQKARAWSDVFKMLELAETYAVDPM